MAQRLSANGGKVALLAMPDAYPHMRQLALGQRLRLAARQARRGFLKFRNASGSAPYQPPAGGWLTPAMQRVRRPRILGFNPLSSTLLPWRNKVCAGRNTIGVP